MYLTDWLTFWCLTFAMEKKIVIGTNSRNHISHLILPSYTEFHCVSCELICTVVRQFRMLTGKKFNKRYSLKGTNPHHIHIVEQTLLSGPFWFRLNWKYYVVIEFAAVYRAAARDVWHSFGELTEQMTQSSKIGNFSWPPKSMQSIYQSEKSGEHKQLWSL